MLANVHKGLVLISSVHSSGQRSPGVLGDPEVAGPGGPPGVPGGGPEVAGPGGPPGVPGGGPEVAGPAGPPGVPCGGPEVAGPGGPDDKPGLMTCSLITFGNSIVAS